MDICNSSYYKHIFINFRLYFTLLLLLPFAVHAEPTQRSSQHQQTLFSAAAIDKGISVHVGRQHQRFDDNSANIDTIALDPYFQIGDWSLSMDIPWQHAQGDYFVNTSQSSTPYSCQVIDRLTDAQLTALLARRPDLQTVVDQCASVGSTTANGGDVSGLSDISTYLGYGHMLDEHGVWFGQITLGLKWDNGDVDDGLGSGTKEIMFEGAINADTGTWLGTFTLGHAAIIGGDLEAEYNDYIYCSIDIATRLSKPLKLGAQTTYQEATSNYLDDITSASVYLTVSPLDQLQLQLMLTDYLDTSDYPNQEITGSITLSF